jgi:hypothetical protein
VRSIASGSPHGEFIGINTDSSKSFKIMSIDTRFKLAWKTLQDYIQCIGVTDIVGPRPVITEAFKLGLISQGENWLELLEDRNSTSHVYNKNFWIKGSDIDIAIYGPNITPNTIHSPMLAYHRSNLPYKLDIIHYESIINPELKNHIDEYGKSLILKSSIII